MNVYSFSHWTTTAGSTRRRGDSDRLFTTSDACKRALMDDLHRTIEFQIVEQCNPNAGVGHQISEDGPNVILKIGSFYKRTYKVVSRQVED